MFVLGLLLCVGLRAFSAQAKVVTDFKECKGFFYKDTEPAGMDQNAKKICQKLENSGFYYASLYSVHHRIPLYSAYTLDPRCSSTAGRTDKWHIEPQISQPRPRIDYMVLENDPRNDLSIIKRSQAISSDYAHTGYDRGHLNPNSFQYDEGRTATFTLTNAAPMDACFNRIRWKNWESTLRSFLLNQLQRDAGSADVYIVTGTVPSANVRIPQREDADDAERVTVPSHIWTAVCYKHRSDNKKSLSFGLLGENRPDSGINTMSVSNLNDQLSELYTELTGNPQSIRIFTDDCFGGNNKLNKVVIRVFEKLINLQRNQVILMNPSTESTLNGLNRAVSSDGTPSKRLRVSEVRVKLAFDGLSAYSTEAEDLKTFTGSACLITRVRPRARKTVGNLRKRDVSEVSDGVECLLVPEKQKTAADGSPCSSYTEYSSFCLCNTAEERKPCCSSPCLYNDELQGYRCYSDLDLIECSPHYSLITVKGDQCRDDHPCATYGKDYYWCNKASSGWDYCSPPLWNSTTKAGKPCRTDHACAKYGKRYRWCYTDEENNWDYC